MRNISKTILNFLSIIVICFIAFSDLSARNYEKFSYDNTQFLEHNNQIHLFCKIQADNAQEFHWLILDKITLNTIADNVVPSEDINNRSSINLIPFDNNSFLVEFSSDYNQADKKVLRCSYAGKYLWTKPLIPNTFSSDLSQILPFSNGLIGRSSSSQNVNKTNVIIDLYNKDGQLNKRIYQKEFTNLNYYKYNTFSLGNFAFLMYGMGPPLHLYKINQNGEIPFHKIICDSLFDAYKLKMTTVNNQLFVGIIPRLIDKDFVFLQVDSLGNVDKKIITLSDQYQRITDFSLVENSPNLVEITLCLAAINNQSEIISYTYDLNTKQLGQGILIKKSNLPSLSVKNYKLKDNFILYCIGLGEASTRTTNFIVQAKNEQNKLILPPNFNYLNQSLYYNMHFFSDKKDSVLMFWSSNNKYFVNRITNQGFEFDKHKEVGLIGK